MQIKHTSVTKVAAIAAAMLILAACSSANAADQTDCPMTIAGGEPGYWLTAQRSEASDTRYASDKTETIELLGTGSLVVRVFDSVDSPASVGSMGITDSGSEPCNFTITVGPGGALNAVQP